MLQTVQARAEDKKTDYRETCWYKQKNIRAIAGYVFHGCRYEEYRGDHNRKMSHFSVSEHIATYVSRVVPLKRTRAYPDVPTKEDKVAGFRCGDWRVPRLQLVTTDRPLRNAQPLVN